MTLTVIERSEAAVMKHELSTSDREFRTAFEAGAYAPADFSHRAHIRLAYVYLAEHDVERATRTHIRMVE